VRKRDGAVADAARSDPLSFVRKFLLNLAAGPFANDPARVLLRFSKTVPFAGSLPSAAFIGRHFIG
jgi:hypothetical protein